MVSENFIQIGLLETDIRNFEGELLLISYDIHLFEMYDQYEKEFFRKTVLYFIFRYHIFWKSISRVKS